MQAVSVAPASFQNRKSLPKAWQGLRDEQLSEAAGIPDCVFVHASGEPPSLHAHSTKSETLHSWVAGVRRHVVACQWNQRWINGSCRRLSSALTLSCGGQDSSVVPKHTRGPWRWHEEG